MSDLWDRIAELPLAIDGYRLERLERDVSSAFTRVTTLVRLAGNGEEGVGEDVVYDAVDHDVMQQAGPTLPLAGSWTLGSFCDHIEALDLFEQPPAREVSRRYRIWTYESGALDLALRQAGRPLHEALEREPSPLRFVVSLRLGSPPSLEPLLTRLDGHAGLRFKLDPTNDWSDDLVAKLAGTGVVESVDFKGRYSGTIVDVEPVSALYERVLRELPGAWIEDPHEGVAAIDALLEPHRDRVSWDAPIHSVADILALPWQPKLVNVKPSRLGPLRELLAAYEHCEANGYRMYGGGQFELGPGRGQIQYLASMFHPDGPNDVAPSGYNDPTPERSLPDSPLPPRPGATGFRWR